MPPPEEQPPASPGRRRLAAGRRPAGWALGLPALALLCLVVGMRGVPRVERDIRHDLVRSLGSESGGALSRFRARTQVDGRDVTVVADLGLPADAQAPLESAVRAVPGVRSVRTEIAQPVAMSPFRFTVRRSASGLVLSGGTPSAELRARLAEEAAGVVTPEAVDDRLRLGQGAPPGFAEAASFVLSAMLIVPDGQAELSDTRFSVRADAPDSASYERLRSLLRAPPPGFVPGAIAIVPPLVRPFTWSARLSGGRLVLSGSVPTEELRARIVADATAALPDATVADEMRTARGLDPRLDFAAAAGLALRSLSDLETGAAELTDSRFSFAGQGVAKDRIAKAREHLREGLPAGFRIASLDFASVPASPFRFSARRAGGRVVLAGFVPDEVARGLAVQFATDRFKGERVVDDLALADGAPDGFAAAQRLALEELANVAEGRAVIRDRDLRLDGRILYRQLAGRVVENLHKAAPAGWNAEAAIETASPERTLDPMQCGDLLTDVVRRDPVRFEDGKAALSAASRRPLDALADVVRRCAASRITAVRRERAGPDEDSARRLAGARAGTLVAALAERLAGAAGGAERLAAEGGTTAEAVRPPSEPSRPAATPSRPAAEPSRPAGASPRPAVESHASKPDEGGQTEFVVTP